MLRGLREVKVSPTRPALTPSGKKSVRLTPTPFAEASP